MEEDKLPESVYVQRYDMYGTSDSFSRGESGQLLGKRRYMGDDYFFLSHHYDIGSNSYHEDLDTYPTDSLREIAEQLYELGFRDLKDLDGKPSDNYDADSETMIVRSPLDSLERGILEREFRDILHESAYPAGDRQLDMLLPGRGTPDMYRQLELF